MKNAHFNPSKTLQTRAGALLVFDLASGRLASGNHRAELVLEWLSRSRCCDQEALAIYSSALGSTLMEEGEAGREGTKLRKGTILGSGQNLERVLE